MQLISKELYEENNLKIHPIEKLTECSTMNGDIFGYEGFVEANVKTLVEISPKTIYF